MEYYNVINQDYIDIVKKHIIVPRMKIVLLDENEYGYKELISEISIENSGSISITYQQGVQKTVSLTIFDPDGDFIPDPNNQNFWVGKKFKIYLGLAIERYYLTKNPLIYRNSIEDLLAYLKNEENIPDIEKDGILLSGNDYIDRDTDIYWFSKGVYITTSIDASHSLADKTISISGVDKFGIFTSDTGYSEMIANYIIKSGTTIEDAISTMLLQDMGNGKSLDPILPVIDPYYIGTKIPYEIDKGAGSYLGDILVELGTMFKADIFYDDDGRFNFKRSMIGDENTQLPIIWDFNDKDSEYISSSLNYNLIDAINTVYVVGDNPNAAIAPEAFRQNKNPSSPLSVDKIGIKSKLYSTSIIKTPTEAADYAEYMLNQLSRIQQTISFTCSFIPHLDVNKSFSLTDSFYKIVKEQFIIQSITFPLGIGTISINGSSIQDLPTYEGGN